ncbi:MAG: response regulator [Chloroflexi bacterium]|nr:response regulator [Chloroflexota bacterium]
MEPVRIIVVGEDRVMGELIVLNLRQRGYLARWVSETGVQAGHVDGRLLSSAQAIIVDDGDTDAGVWRLARALRDQQELLHIPLMLLVATWPDRRRVAALAPCSWLHKPYSMATLISELERSLAGARLAEVCAVDSGASERC